jgi:CHAT domain-containing protein
MNEPAETLDDLNPIDPIALRQRIEQLGVDNNLRPPGASRDDLLDTAALLERAAVQLNVPEFLVAARMRCADILLALERNSEAIVTLDLALQTLGPLRPYDLRVFILVKQAVAHARLEDWASVDRVCHAGIALVEKYRFHVTSQYQQSAYLRDRIPLYTLGVRAALILGQSALALERAELAKCRSVLRYRQPTDAATPRQQDVEANFRRVREEIDRKLKAGEPIPDSLQDKRRSLWDLVAIQRFQSRDANALPEFNLPAIQQTLAETDAILYYFWLDSKDLLVALLDRRHFTYEIRRISTATRQEIEASIDQFSANGRGQIRSFTNSLWPSDDGLLDGKTRLFISPHRLLHAIPFHGFPYRDEPLIETFAVIYIPNLCVLLIDRPAAGPQCPQRVLGMGISHFDTNIGSQPDLKDAEAEVQEIKSLYQAAGQPVDILLGPDATKKNFLQHNLAEYSCLHFATHGRNLEVETPMESCLYFVDSRLEGLEIADWNLNADLVVLTACFSGKRATSGRGMHELPGDDLLGLQAAFYIAGARQILCALWPVESKAARQIIVETHRFLAAGYLPEFALQAALKLYRSRARILGKVLEFWAPFFITQLGRPSPTPKKSTFTESPCLSLS